MRYLLAFGPLLVALIGAFALFGPTSGSASPQPPHIVYVNDIDFCGTSGANCPQPYAISIDPGDQVVFRDGNIGAAHSVTECLNGSFNNCGGAGRFDSGIQNLAPGQDYFPSPLTLDPGTYYYRCNVHLFGMTGTIQVGDATPSPTPSPSPSPTVAPTPTSSPTASPTTAPTPTGQPTPHSDGTRRTTPVATSTVTATSTSTTSRSSSTLRGSRRPRRAPRPDRQRRRLPHSRHDPPRPPRRRTEL